MPLRVSNQCEKDVHCIPTAVKVVADSVATDVLPALKGSTVEFASRYIQNVGGNDAYYSFGYDCSSAQYCGIISAASKQQLDCSNHGDRVSVFSVGGTSFAITLLARADLHQGGNIINGSL